MKTFKQLLFTLYEKVGDFGNPPEPIKINCYGKKVKYAMAPGKKACAFKRKR
jgi:hypothetical protein